MSRNQIRIEFESKSPFAGGASFGKTGAYERLLGTVSFAIDPDEKDLPFVCDLEFAPRNAEGLVEFKAVLDIVKPVDLNRGNGKLLFEGKEFFASQLDAGKKWLGAWSINVQEILISEVNQTATIRYTLATEKEGNLIVLVTLYFDKNNLIKEINEVHNKLEE